MKSEYRCLFCGKLLLHQESGSLWHEDCAKAHFKDPVLPNLAIKLSEFDALALEALKHGESLSGPQKKLALGLSPKTFRGRLVPSDLNKLYILKPQSSDFPHLPEAEEFGMDFAEAMGVPVVPHALVRLADHSIAYLSKRVDRKLEGNELIKIPFEDFAQLAGISPAQKYRGSYERAALVIDHYSRYPLLDKADLFYRVLVSFVLGNSDLHYKSLYLQEDSKGGYALAPANDLVPVALFLGGDGALGLSLLGKKSQIHRKDFVRFGSKIGLYPKTVNVMIEKVLSLQEVGLTCCAHSYLPQNEQSRWNALYLSRLNALRFH
ncbi:MAG: hypothetical protein BWY98_00435 [Tenericutes bacterium ADurb.BinA155]|nr:MAG: hypothetical protein BWY98_00435 [Tenericutes bacterium ADurb.BinA155]